jgi:hypothetical protein
MQFFYSNLLVYYGIAGNTKGMKTHFLRKKTPTCYGILTGVRGLVFPWWNSLESLETVSQQSGNCEWVCRRSWALKSYDSVER